MSHQSTLQSVDIKSMHEDYTNRVSSKSACISLETSIFLWNLCDALQPKIAVDTGSGFSSYILRKWSTNKNCSVYSFDDNAFWLNKSVEYCALNNVSIQNFLLWQDVSQDITNVDILIHDLGNMTLRANTLEKVYDMMSKNGTIVLDDLHKNQYFQESTRFFNSKGHSILEIKETYDSFGRFVGIVSLNGAIAK